MSAQVERFGHFIHGEHVLEGDVEERRNPADRDEVVAEYHDGSEKILNDALASCRAAFQHLAKTTRRDRGEVLWRMAALLDTTEWRNRFKNAMIDEIGKTTTSAVGEINKTIRILLYMSGLSTHTRDDVVHPDQAGALMYTKKYPVQTAGAVTPFNFPLAVPAWKIAPAFVAGAPTLWKPSPAAPKTSALIMELFNEAMRQVAIFKEHGAGALNMVYGGADIARAMINDPRVEAFSFTGSTEAGMALYRASANREKPMDPRHFTAEMGGQNALVVMPDVADVREAVQAFVMGAYKGEGQRCTATSRAVLHKDIADAFLEELELQTAALKIGPGRVSSNDVGPLVSEEALEKAVDAVAASITGGMQLVRGGQRLSNEEHACGNFLEPTLLMGDPYNPKHLALREEVFADVAAACEVGSLEEAIDVTNSVPHTHAASLFTTDLRSAIEFSERVRAGLVHINNPTIGGDAQAPFGGFGGDTSLGMREMGPHAMDVFLKDKTIDINPGGKALGHGVR